MDFSQIDPTIKAIAEFGILIVIAALFLIQTIQNNKILRGKDKKNQDTVDNMQKAREDCSAEYQKIVQDAIRKYLQKDDHNQELVRGEEFAYALNERKQAILKRGLSESGASQVLYFSYHNGGTDFMGIPFQRMSCTHMVSSENAPHYTNRFKDMFRVTFYHIYKNLLELSHVEVPNMDELREKDPATFESFKNCAKAVFVHNIKNIKGAEVGFVLFTYLLAIEDEDEIKLQAERVQNTAYRLEGVLQSAEIEYKENIRNKIYEGSEEQQQ